MKTKIVMTAAVLLLGVGTALQAQNPPNALPPGAGTQETTSSGMGMANANTSTERPAVGGPYRSCELSLDAFGLGTVDEYTIDHLSGHRVDHDSRLGAGMGLEYFITRYVGLEAEAFSGSTSHTFVDDLGGNLVLRLPIGESGFAPYIFGGGGHIFDPASGTYGDGGAGIEYRFTPHVGLFTDARFVATDRIGNYGMGRFGLRFTF